MRHTYIFIMLFLTSSASALRILRSSRGKFMNTALLPMGVSSLSTDCHTANLYSRTRLSSISTSSRIKNSPFFHHSPYSFSTLSTKTSSKRRYMSKVISNSSPSASASASASSQISSSFYSSLSSSSSSSSSSTTTATSSQKSINHDDNVTNPSHNVIRLGPKPRVVFVLGGPGAGKGTQCAKLSLEYGMQHLSAGELLREERLSGSSNGQLIETYLKNGQIVPVQITLDLLKAAMLKSPCNRFLVDGFPRNQDNVNGWESSMQGVCDVEAVIFIDCPEDKLEERLLSRGLTSGRSDDNIVTAKKRFATFKNATLPIVEYYEKQGMLLRIKGDQCVEAVFEDLKKKVAPLLTNEIIHLTQGLLDAISNNDWKSYSSYCDPKITAFEPESRGHLVEGLEFHKFYFEDNLTSSHHEATTIEINSNSKHVALDITNSNHNQHKHMQSRSNRHLRSIIALPQVKHMGKAAIIAYERHIHDETTGKIVSKQEETRVWQLQDGAWKNIHFHRSAPL